jgi:pyrroloquinoline quinone (PQQ) biosynthesis protein C
MSLPLKKMYGLRMEGSTVNFFRRGVEHAVELPRIALARALPYLQTRVPLDNLQAVTGVTSADLIMLKSCFEEEGLVAQPETADAVSGKDFYANFRAALSDWMQEAFSAPYWDVMLSGKGSQALYVGYLLELYHYTRNANRHMPMIVANCPPEWKEIKRLLAVHYFEEWNHYDFFADALVAMGVPKADVETSDQLPSTLEMSNFMRQAARTSPLCYAICSAILEGTTEDSGSYGEYFRKIAPLYDIPDDAIQPLFDHLAMDIEYNHKSLFEDICLYMQDIPRAEAERAMSFGQQMVDHIYLWTEQIHRHYGRENAVTVRRKFELIRD